MSIKKQEFYEGAALHLLARNVDNLQLRYESPYFILNGEILVYFKYSTKGRSPWGFTLNATERKELDGCRAEYEMIVGLICGDDGVAAVSYDELSTLIDHSVDASHISCYRKHHEHYEVNGPNGTLSFKVAPSAWPRILDKRVTREA